MPDLAHVSRLLADAHRLLSDQSLGRDELMVAIAMGGGKIAAAMKLLAETAERPEWPRPNIRVTGRKVAARFTASPWLQYHLGVLISPQPVGLCLAGTAPGSLVHHNRRAAACPS